MVIHRTFISYHHADHAYRQQFEGLFGLLGGAFLSWSVDIGDIPEGLAVDTVWRRIREEYLRDSTVTVVLVGRMTWSRKYVDWEIGSSIRQSLLSPRSGLLGLLLPSHPSWGQPLVDPGLLPPRLVNNIDCGYATLHPWPKNAEQARQWIHEAYERRYKVEPNNSYPWFIYNKSADRWC